MYIRCSGTTAIFYGRVSTHLLQWMNGDLESPETSKFPSGFAGNGHVPGKREPASRNKNSEFVGDTALQKWLLWRSVCWLHREGIGILLFWRLSVPIPPLDAFFLKTVRPRAKATEKSQEHSISCKGNELFSLLISLRKFGRDSGKILNVRNFVM